MKTQTAKTLTGLVGLIAAGLTVQAQYTYTTLDFPSTNYTTYPQGIDGTNIVGYYFGTDVEYGFLYNGSGWTTLDSPLGIGQTFATGVSGTNIVGYYSDTNGVVHGFLYNSSSWTTLDDPLGAGSTHPQGISGTNIVGYFPVKAAATFTRWCIPAGIADFFLTA